MTSRTTLVAAIAAALVVPAILVATPVSAAPFPATVPGHAGHQVPVVVYPAAVTPAPTLLWGHGWAGSTADSATYGNYFSAHGYNVVAMDFRGHGGARSSSAARVHDVDYEIKDVSAVIDWIATKPWAQLDAPGDPTLGALGGSYGGGYQLLTAVFDDRLDAIAPEITWHDLPHSLAPHGGIKSAWVDLLYWGGNARANLDPIIHQGYAWAMTTNDFPDGTLPGEPDIVSLFERNSPKAYPADISLPTLLIQGVPDTLFNLNEAMANADQIDATGAPVKLYTHLGGHILSTVGTIPGGLPESGLQDGAAGSPCGDVKAVTLAFYDAVLKGQGSLDAIPDVSLALPDLTCATIDDVFGAGGTPFYSLETRTPALAPTLAAGASAELRLAGTGRTAATTLPLGVATTAGVLGGIPTLDAHLDVLGASATVYFSILVNGDIVDAQVTPLRLAPGSHDVSIDLGGIATRVAPGDAIALGVSTWDAQFAHNGDRQPGAVVLSDVSVGLPHAR